MANVRAATWAAAVVLALGAAVLAGYWVALALSGLHEAPLLLKLALAGVAAGCALLLLTAILQRLRDRREEDLEGIEY